MAIERERRRRKPPDLTARMMTKGPLVKASEPVILCWDKNALPDCPKMDQFRERSHKAKGWRTPVLGAVQLPRVTLTIRPPRVWTRFISTTMSSPALTGEIRNQLPSGRPVKRKAPPAQGWARSNER